MPVLVGTAASGELIAWRFTAALIVAVALQVAVNYANDYFDATKGVDSDERVGPRRLTAAGLVEPAAMKVAIAAALFVACVAGIALAVAVGWELLAVGAAALLAALGYSGGPKPYGASGLGELAVFLFFGVVATTGSAYVQTGSIQALPLALSIPVGLLAVALLVVNNARDARTDAVAGKMTLAVRHGVLAMRRLFAICVIDPFLILLALWLVTRDTMMLLPLPAIVLALHSMRKFAVADEETEWLDALVATARLQTVFGLALAVGLWL